MKYKVAKEMPHIAIGTEVKVESGKFKYMPNVSIKRDDCYEQVYFEHELPYLIENGWIEEVKPREWYVLECNNPGLLWESEAIKVQLKKNPDLKFIKVREIL